MGYCGPRGIPYMHWLGGPPGWTHRDRELALGWLLRERRRCSSCGLHPDDDPDDYRARRHQCPGCAKLELTRKRHDQRAKDTAEVPGGYWSLDYIAATARASGEDPAEVDDDEEGGEDAAPSR